MHQIIKDGPYIPTKIEQALSNDSLVFFCGAGISAQNNLPLFKDLVRKVCRNLNININSTPILKELWKREHYDSVLDLIEEGQLFSVSRETLIKEVSKILNNYTGAPDMHRSLLDLSEITNKKGHRLVTTNFDKLFFEAGLDLKFSDCAPKLAPPRKERWKNLTFLHGLIDKDNDPEGNNLILTRRDFGLAYLYDNWASKFIIQLFQDFTVLFIGYSVNDPVMNYLVSAISYENNRRKQNQIDNERIKAKKNSSAYAFVGYKEGEEKTEENKWRSIGIEPITYKIKANKDHSLLYESIKEWANRKRTGLTGRRHRLKETLKLPYTEATDKDTILTVISDLETDKKLSEYFPQINFSSNLKQMQPVDISWLEPFAKHGLIKKLTNYTYQQSFLFMWAPLSQTEVNIAKWILLHLDKKELIHWLIDQVSQNHIINLHPVFKDMIKSEIDRIETDKSNITLDERKMLFWKIVTTQKDYSENSMYFRITQIFIQLNQKYSPLRAKELLENLEPQVKFNRHPSTKESLSYDNNDYDHIYDPELVININNYPTQLRLTNSKTLLFHAEDFSNLLKKAMEQAKVSEIIQNGYNDHLSIERPYIENNLQNTTYHRPWTYLIDLTRDSFNLAMEQDKKLADLLLTKWQYYPYSIFYRLIFYAVTKHPTLNETIILNLLKKEKHHILWLPSCENEVLEYLRKKEHSPKAIKKLLCLIMKGPSRSLFTTNDSAFNEIRNIKIYERLTALKKSGIQFPEDVQNQYNGIQSKYSLQESTLDENKYDFPYYRTEARIVGSEKKYHNQSSQKIYEDIKSINQNTSQYEIDNKRENFRQLVKDKSKTAYEVLLLFQDEETNIHPYFISPFFGVFISEIDTVRGTEVKQLLFKILKKIEYYNDDFIKKILWQFTHGFNLFSISLYLNDKDNFDQWWNKLWNLSIKEKSNNNSGISLKALNSHLGKLSQSVFHILWNKFSNKIPKNGKIPEEIKKYFDIIIKQGINTEFSILYHFGSDLWNLWYLDRDWTKNLKLLMIWSTQKNVCKSLWTGYLHHPNWSPDFLHDFKNEFLNLILNKSQFYKKNSSLYTRGYCETIDSLMLIATGCREIKNIFPKKESKKITQNINANTLKSISRELWVLLKDSEDKSSFLWSKKIKPWIEQFWPKQISLKNCETARYLSLLILNCGEKLPEAFQFLKSNIKDIIQIENEYILYHIEDSKDKLNHIFDYPTELLSLLNWNFPNDTIHSDYGSNHYTKKIKLILDNLKERHSDIENNKEYKKLYEKLSH